MTFDSLRGLTNSLDTFLRFADFYAQRTDGGLLARIFKIRRHTLSALLLPFLLIGFLFLASPSTSRAIWAILGAISVSALLWYFMQQSENRRWPVRMDLVMQAATILLCGLRIWVLGPDQYRDQGPYRHILIPIAAAVSIALLVAAALARRVFHRVQQDSKYAEYLKQTELFASRGAPPQVTLVTILTALLTASFRAPIALLTPPAIAALLATPVWLVLATSITFAISWFAMFVAGLNERFGIMWSLIQEVFFKGGGMLVSIVVIVLAAARVAGVTYVTTVFDTATWWTIGLALAFFYVLSWWYDYWSNRLIAEEVLVMLCADARGRAQIPYTIGAAAESSEKSALILRTREQL